MPLSRAVDPDSHGSASFFLLDADPLSICVSGSRREKFKEKTKSKEIIEHFITIFTVNLDQLHDFYTYTNLCCIFN